MTLRLHSGRTLGQRLASHLLRRRQLTRTVWSGRFRKINTCNKFARCEYDIAVPWCVLCHQYEDSLKVYECSQGSAVYLYGGGNSSFQVSVDEDTENLSPPSGSLLYSKEGLSSGTHNLTLTALPTIGQQLFLDNAVIAQPLLNGSVSISHVFSGRNADSFLSTDVPIPIVYDSSNITAIKYSGTWTTTIDPQIPNASRPLPFRETTAGNAYALLDFTGGTAVAINGAKNCGHATYSVVRDSFCF